MIKTLFFEQIIIKKNHLPLLINLISKFFNNFPQQDLLKKMHVYPIKRLDVLVECLRVD